MSTGRILRDGVQVGTFTFEADGNAAGDLSTTCPVQKDDLIVFDGKNQQASHEASETLR